MTPGHKVLKAFKDRRYQVVQYGEGLRGEPNDWTNTDDSEIAGLIEQESGIVELASILKEILEVLQKEAPGTPLNNRKYDGLGIKAHAVLAAYEDRS